MQPSPKSTQEKAEVKPEVKKPDLTPEEETLCLRAFYGGYYSAVKDIVNTFFLLVLVLLFACLLVEKLSWN